MEAELRIGVDLGGTKIEVVLMDGAGRMRIRRRVATPGGDYEGTVRTVAELVRAVEAEAGAGAALPTGVGIPGSVSPHSGRIRNANSVCLNDRPLQADLERALGRPLRLENDANCLALSEAVDGAGRGERTVFAVILGTGVGGGLVVDGRLQQGRNGIAGEWSHNPLPWMRPEEYPGPICWCGRQGCIETFLCGPGLTQDFENATGERVDARNLAAKAADGDEDAEAALKRYESRLSRALATVINVLDPDVVVLGGGVSNLERLYANVPRLWVRHVFTDVVDTPLKRAAFGDSSGVRGAAWLWGRPPLLAEFC